MGLYDSQMRQRVKNDEESLTHAFVKLSGVLSFPKTQNTRGSKAR